MANLEQQHGTLVDDIRRFVDASRQAQNESTKQLQRYFRHWRFFTYGTISITFLASVCSIYVASGFVYISKPVAALAAGLASLSAAMQSAWSRHRLTFNRSTHEEIVRLTSEFRSKTQNELLKDTLEMDQIDKRINNLVELRNECKNFISELERLAIRTVAVSETIAGEESKARSI